MSWVLLRDRDGQTPSLLSLNHVASSADFLEIASMFFFKPASTPCKQLQKKKTDCEQVMLWEKGTILKSNMMRLMHKM